MSREGLDDAINKLGAQTAKDRKVGMQFFADMSDPRKIKALTNHHLWPSLIQAAMAYVNAELSTSRKKTEDFGAIFLSVLRRAPLREAGWPLAPLMDQLLVAVLHWVTEGKQAVEKSALASLDFIIMEPKYCNSIKRQCIGRLLHMLLAQIMEEEGDLTQESITYARIFANVTANYRRDIPIEAATGMPKTSGEWLKKVCICCGYWMSKQRPDEQKNMKVFAEVAEEIVGALNALLFKYGVNCILHLDYIPPGHSECLAEMALSFMLQNYQQVHGTKTLTFLEGLRLQLHLARARYPLPTPWAIHNSDPIAQKLDKIFRLVWGEAKGSARKIEEVSRSMSRKGRDIWVDVEYRDRLVWVLTAEVACAYQYYLNENPGSGAGRRTSASDDEESVSLSSTATQWAKRVKSTGPMEQLRDALRVVPPSSSSASAAIGMPSSSSGASQMVMMMSQQAMLMSQMTQGGGGGVADRQINVTNILAALQVLTALFENFPKGGETWLLDPHQTGEGVIEIINLLESLLVTRPEVIVLMWTATTLTAIARIQLGKASSQRRGGQGPAEEINAAMDEEEQDEAPLDRAMTEAWRGVLETILRPDLKCWGATAKLHKGSLGERVLCLLVAIIEARLVPEADLVNLQGRLWSLPAFQSTVHGSHWPIALVRALVRNTEVLEGPDVINSRDMIDLESAMEVDDDGEDDGGAMSQPHGLATATTRAERLTDYVLRWAKGQLQGRGDIRDRSSSLSLALATALELSLSIRLDLAQSEDNSFTRVGRLWVLTSPWQCLAEGDQQKHHIYLGLRQRLFKAERYAWRRETTVAAGVGASRPAAVWMDLAGKVVLVTGRGRPLRRGPRRREGGNGALLGRVMAHLRGWGRQEEDQKKKEDEDEEVTRALLWLKTAIEARLVGGEGSEEAEGIVTMALRRAQDANWRSLRNHGVVLMAMQELIREWPLCLEQGKGIDAAGWLMDEEGDQGGLTEASVPKEVLDAFVYLKHRADTMVQYVIPAGNDGITQAGGDSDDTDDAMDEDVADPEGDELMKDDEDDSPAPSAKQKRKAVETASKQQRVQKKSRIAEQVGQSRYSLQDLLNWARVALLANPEQTVARDFIQRAADLAVDDSEVELDVADLLEDSLFRTTSPVDYPIHIGALEWWVMECHPSARRGRSTNGKDKPPVAHVTEEVRYAVALRVVASLASSPPWLSKALQPHAEHLRNVCRLLAKEDLSWYNCLFEFAARRAIFDNEQLCGDAAADRAFLVNTVSAASHVDADVRYSSILAFVSAFKKYKNGPVLWDTFRKKKVLGGPPKASSSSDAEEEDPILGMGKIMAVAAVGREQGAAGRETDKVTRLAVSTLCCWWGQCMQSPAISGMAEAGLRDLAEALGYPAVSALLSDHLGYLLHDWLVVNHTDIRCFPCNLAGWADIATFVRDNMALLVPITCLCQPSSPSYRFELLARLAEDAGFGADRPTATGKEGRISLALTEYIIELKAYQVLLSTQTSAAAVNARDEFVAFVQRSCAAWTQTHVNEHRILPYIQDLVVAMLDSLSSEPYAYFEDVGDADKRVPPVGLALDALAKDVLGGAPDVVWTECNPGEILLHLKVRLAQATSPARASRLLGLLSEVLDRMDAVARDDSTLGLTLHVLLWTLERHAKLRLECLQVLDRFLTVCLDRNKGGSRAAELLGKHHLSALVGSLYTLLVKGEERGYEESVGDMAVALIKRLVVDEKALQGYCASLDPLPKLEKDGGWERELRVVRATMEKKAGDALLHPMAYARHLAATVDRSAGLGRAGQVTRLVALQALQGRLAQSPPRDAEALRILVPTLLSLTRDRKASPPSVRLEAAKALGAIGALPPCDLLVWEPSARAMQSSKGSSSPCYEAMMRALSRLVDLLTDAEADTVQLVLTTLRSVLQMPPTTAANGEPQRPQLRPEMAELISYMAASSKSSSSASHDDVDSGLRSEHRQILSSFGRSRVLHTSSLHQDATKAAPPPRSNTRAHWSTDVWNPPSLPFDEWVTRLASTLIRYGIPDVNTSKWQPAEEFQTLLRFLGSCQHVCQARAALAETLLPLIILGMIKGHPPESDVVERLSSCVSRVLPKAADPRRLQVLMEVLRFLREQCIYEALKAQAASSRSSKRSSSSMAPPGGSGVQALMGYLDLDCLMVAKAALRCGALSTALLFVELHREKSQQKEEENDEAALLFDQVGEVQSLLLSILSRMAEMDGVHGVRPSNGLEFRATAGAARERADWRQALASFDTLMQQRDAAGPSEGVALALQKLDMQHVLGSYLTSLQAQADGAHSTTLRELEYERRWRACRWEPIGQGLIGPEAFVPHYGPSEAAPSCLTTPGLLSQEEDASAYHEHLHACLRALAGKDSVAVARHLRSARLKTLACLTHEVPFEASRRLPQLLGRLQGLCEFEEVANVALEVGPMSVLAPSTGRLGADTEARSVLDTWRQRSSRLGDDFELCEPLFALREVILRALCPPLDPIKELVAHVCATSEAARRGGSVTVAASAVNRIDQIVAKSGEHVASVMDVERCAWKLEQSRVLWVSGEHDLAIRTAAAVGRVLQGLEITHNVDEESRDLMVKALQQAGHWMAEAGTEGTTKIIDEYMQPAVDLAVGKPVKKAARLTLAKYLTSLFHRRSERTRGQDWAKEQEVFDDRKRELAAIRAQLNAMANNDPKRKDVMRRNLTLEKELKLDEEEHAAYLRSIDSFLLNALENFKEALMNESLDEPDLGPVFQVTALWFDKANISKPEVNTKMAELAKDVPTYKFVPLIYQVLSMLGSEHKDFEDALELLVTRTCQHHPHHTLLQLFGLYHGKRVPDKDKQAYEQIPRLEDKIQAAERVLNNLKRSSSTLADLLTNLEKLLDGYISLSMTNTVALAKANRIKNIEFSSIPSAPANVKSFHNILGRSPPVGGRGSASSTSTTTSSALQPPTSFPAVLSHWPELDPTGQYRHVVRVTGFEPRFNLADSGLSRPMIIVCLGSDGKKYRQVLKADDVRPDAVMMQVFDTMNALLRQDPESRRRQLRIRTYRIVSLTPFSGAMEFVENTKTLGNILVGGGESGKGLHERYNTGKDELRSSECRERLKNAKNIEERRVAYLRIMKRFHPAFRFFFLERYPDPALWYRRRLHYTRSVAVSSIVGYLLGIGDRHASNILIDQSNAGIVHIDFGYTFEQGKVLPQPETVPFRLTRDLVDAMGVTGTEGVFRQCCDVTMQVMRQHSASLLTILEVIARDPLHKWQAAALQTGKGGGDGGAGDDDEDEDQDSRHGRRIKVRKAGAASADAERVLLRVRQKLKGNEDPNGEAMSVQGHVKYLINQATDPHNLAVIYHGWSPYL